MTRDPAKTILILEDDEGVARLQQRRLERAGFVVRCVMASVDALEQIRRGGIDLLVLDNQLSPTETGLDFYKHLKSCGYDLPVIMVTGYSDDATIIQALRAGVRDYVFKSVEYLEYIPEAVQRALEHEQTKEQLAGSQALLRAVMHASLDAIVFLNEDDKVTLFNPAAERLFRCSETAALGSPISRWLPAGLPAPSEPFPLWPDPIPSGMQVAPHEIEGRRADGQSVPLEVTYSRVELPNQILYKLILRDISERVQAEKQLRETSEQRQRALADLQAKSEELRSTTQQLWQAAKLAGVGELAASIAHEINNPLGTVSLQVESLLAKTPADDPRRKPLEIIEQEVERMGRLVGNLLQFSRAGRSQVSTVDVCEEILKTIELTEHHLLKRKVRIATDFRPGVPIIYADRQHLRQVFLNLFTNAGDAMQAGGTLTIRVWLAEIKPGRPAVLVEITDTGVGIAAEHLPRVTDAFFTTKEEGKGTGLGLAICRRIVLEHNGLFQIESEPGKGTTVRITMPVKNGANRAALTNDLSPAAEMP